MKIVFVHRGGPTMATFRYRTQMPANYLDAEINAGHASIVVFSKPMDGDLELAREVKGKAKVVADLCDDHLDQPLYRDMLGLADLVITGTQEMKRRLLGVEEKPIIVIPDPYEEAEKPPHSVGKQALWFGHPKNQNALEPWLPYLKPLNVSTLSQEWTAQRQSDALSEANFTLLPTRKGDEFKTANRLLNSLRAGCFPLCDHHPSYEEFRKFVWIGHPQNACQWLSEFNHITDELVLEGQEYIRDRYSPEAIGEKWKKALDSI